MEMESKDIFNSDLEKEQAAQRKNFCAFAKKKSIGGLSLEACG
jgi:hypothetical protein